MKPYKIRWKTGHSKNQGYQGLPAKHENRVKHEFGKFGGTWKSGRNMLSEQNGTFKGSGIPIQDSQKNMKIYNYTSVTLAWILNMILNCFYIILFHLIKFSEKKWKICLVIFDRFLIIFYIFDPRILKFVYSK